MNILIIGSGGREHAFAWKIKQSPKCNNLFVAPGNAGTSAIATNLDLGVSDFDGITTAISSHNIDLVVVGPEVPLVEGLRDHLESQDDLKNLLIVGPSKNGAQLEGSKEFSKEFMFRHGIPTAEAKTITKENVKEGVSFLRSLEAPYVLKADGLAAGKGVIITSDLEEAEDSLEEMLDGQFGDASSKVLIEEHLNGIELSVFVLTDGENYIILPEAKDYKRIGENDEGPNTGGMGAVSPVSFAQGDFLNKVEEKVVVPTINGLKKDNIDFIGFVFIGLMNCGGEPYVIEYNVRMGDPETQVVLPRISSDFLEHLVATAKRELNNEVVTFKKETATTVVAVAGGYPGNYAKGKVINGLDKDSTAITFHAGTSNKNSEVVTNGGRVLASTGLGSSIEEALNKSYENLSGISYEEMNFRKDIGQDLIRLES
ncbi:MAG: phosphoribosylamine--glycine ligase [Reichenbachiella sp.]